jgi:hypothetical protein
MNQHASTVPPTAAMPASTYDPVATFMPSVDPVGMDVGSVGDCRRRRGAAEREKGQWAPEEAFVQVVAQVIDMGPTQEAKARARKKKPVDTRRSNEEGLRDELAKTRARPWL